MPPHFLSQPLAEASRRAVGSDEPIWSALVGKETQRPYEGFYALARQIRPEHASLDDEDLRQKERERCYAAAR